MSSAKWRPFGFKFDNIYEKKKIIKTPSAKWQPFFVSLIVLTHPPGQNGRHFADDIYGFIFVNEDFHILIKILLEFVHNGPIDNNPALV